MLPISLQHIINKLPQAIQEIIAMVVLYFEGKLSEQSNRIKELEDQLKKNSQNSSKLPSTDSPYEKPQPKSRRNKSGKKAGGQKGHSGSTLRMTATPDKIEHHQMSNVPPVNQ